MKCDHVLLFCIQKKFGSTHHVGREIKENVGAIKNSNNNNNNYARSATRPYSPKKPWKSVFNLRIRHLTLYIQIIGNRRN